MTRRRSLLAAFGSALCTVAAAAQRPDPAAVEALHVWTLEQQAGASHASGQRPELGPTLLADLVSGEARTLRVGLTPSAFAGDGSLRLEYDPAAAHQHARVEIGGSGEVLATTAGAQGRALRGADFAQILSGYYTGVELGSAPFLLTAASPTAALELRRGDAGTTLLIEASGRPAIEIQANTLRLRLDAAEGALGAMSLGSAPGDGVDRLRLRLLDGGSAIVRLRLEQP